MSITLMMVGALIFLFFFVLWISWKDRRLMKKLQTNYDPNNDRSRKGEARKRELGSFERANRGTPNTNSPSRYQTLPTALIIEPESNSNGVGKTSTSNRSFYSRFSRK